MITAQQFWLGVVLGPVIVGLAMLIMGGVTKRAVTASEGRIIDKIDRVEKDIVENKGEIKTLHARVTKVAEDHAGLRGEFNAATRPDSKSGIRKFQQ